MPDSKKYVAIALPLPLRRALTYEVPEKMQGEVSPGRRVLVPLGKRILTGVVLGPAEDRPLPIQVRPLRELLDEEISLSERTMKFLSWVARYYFQPIGEVVQLALPAGTSTRSEETFLLTDKGKEALEKGTSGRTCKTNILQILMERGAKGVSLNLLQRSFSLSLRAPLKEMQERGWVSKREDMRQPRVKEKKTLWARLLKNAEGIPLTLRQEEILRIVREAGEISLRDLQEMHPSAPSILPKLKAKGVVEIFERNSFRAPPSGLEGWGENTPPSLTDDQRKAVDEISAAVQAGKFRPFLLHGITGSGKTEVYLRALQEVLSQGRQGLLLVPEISLTAQLVAYFRSRIQHPMAVLHSGLSSGERYDEWRRVKKGMARLVIGARSAVFAPLEAIGIIIVDEEHDPSYKQDEKVRYHARDIALVRGKMENSVVVLGSATPSLESYFNALEKKFRLLSLPCRIDAKPLPQIEIIDMRREKEEGKERPIFSRSLAEAVKENARRGEQALLFLNRRGFSTFILCRDCGFTYRCPNCSVSLTYHASDKTLRCHYCEYTLPGPDRCPQCASLGLGLFGIGTQKLEEEIKKKFPQIQAGRMDRDTTSGKASHERILGRVRRGELNLLVGTQMITKGHDLPGVTLVGVLAADLSLNVPDFRAGERTFQLLTQVAGRAGRGPLPGRVLIQTYNPDHYSIRMAEGQDYPAFYRLETQFRREMNYPPFSRLINFRWEGNSEERVAQFSQSIDQLVSEMLREEGGGSDPVQVLGPCPAPLARLKGKYRCLMLLKGKKRRPLRDFAERLLARTEREISLPGVKLIIDVDPVHML